MRSQLQYHLNNVGRTAKSPVGEENNHLMMLGIALFRKIVLGVERMSGHQPLRRLNSLALQILRDA